MEIEVGQHEMNQIVTAFHDARIIGTKRKRNFAPRRCVDRPGIERLQERDSVRDPLF